MNCLLLRLCLVTWFGVVLLCLFCCLFVRCVELVCCCACCFVSYLLVVVLCSFVCARSFSLLRSLVVAVLVVA